MFYLLLLFFGTRFVEVDAWLSLAISEVDAFRTGAFRFFTIQNERFGINSVRALDWSYSLKTGAH